MAGTITLILGGARSGKSRHALALAHAASTAARPCFVATATAGDAEMAERIAAHKRERGEAFDTVEAPLELVAALGAEARPGRAVVVDCLTFWLHNLMAARRDVARDTAALVAALAAAAGPIILVSNEVGLGIVPDNALARAFRDAAGRLNQAVAAAAHRVVFMAAGLPLVLKGG
jgi:adenosylcobinamide kinase/adenosylcobinamide-phosphate guanylyltransferase